ncbi:MAG: sulfite exporter TauE/SafE family protein, partial [Gammaproteobacteria bacterium]
MDYVQLIILTSVGVIAGWLNVMAGGGSLLTVPIMLFMGIPGPVANGTNRIGILMQNIAAVSTFFKKGHSDFKLGFSLAGAACIGAVGGAMIGVNLDGEWFDRLLALTMIVVMLMMLTKSKTKSAGHEQTANPGKLLLGHVLMVGAGFWGGLIQVGVGFILMPILYRVMGFDLVKVNMYKVF